MHGTTVKVIACRLHTPNLKKIFFGPLKCRFFIIYKHSLGDDMKIGIRAPVDVSL